MSARTMIAAIEARAGDVAEHKDGLDPRRVTRVELPFVWLDILGTETGPFPAENYEFYRDQRQAPGSGIRSAQDAAEFLVSLLEVALEPGVTQIIKADDHVGVVHTAMPDGTPLTIHVLV